jgi:CRISPR-associated protein Csb3
MPELRIAMDPLNPGQFYACCGLIELFDMSGAEVLSRFELDLKIPRRATFVLESAQPLDLGSRTGALRQAACEQLPHAEEAATVAPLRLPLDTGVLELDWWLDVFRDGKTRLKCWAGQQTSYSILSELIRLLPEAAGDDCFHFEAMTTSRFGVDPRSSWKPLDFGFSPNEQKRESATFPVTEVLAAVGLQGFRPALGSERGSFRYSLWRAALPRIAARSACGEPWEGLGAALYAFRVADRGSYKFFEFGERRSH